MTRSLRHITIGFALYGAFTLSLTTLASVGLLVAGTFQTEPMSLFWGLASVVSIVGFMACLPPFIAAYGLHYQRPWARVAALIASGLMMHDLPIGFALGLYALLTLCSEEGVEALKHKPVAALA